MNDSERDVMLGAIHQKTEDIVKEISTMNKHLAVVNGNLQKHQDNLVAINTTVYGKDNDKGMAHDVRSNRKKISKIQLWLYVLVALLVSAGILNATDVIHIFGG